MDPCFQIDRGFWDVGRIGLLLVANPTVPKSTIQEGEAGAMVLVMLMMQILQEEILPTIWLDHSLGFSVNGTLRQFLRGLCQCQHTEVAQADIEFSFHLSERPCQCFQGFRGRPSDLAR